VVYGAISKINHFNANGYGQVAKLHFQVSTQLTQTSTMYFSVNDVYVIDSSGTNQLFNYGPDLAITVDPMPTALKEQSNENNITIYPNPYADKTQISYSLNKKCDVQIDVLNSLGQKVKNVSTGNQLPGKYSFDFSAKEMGLGAGIYFIKLNMDGKIITKKIIELK
jgi:hypothetical protein